MRIPHSESSHPTSSSPSTVSSYHQPWATWTLHESARVPHIWFLYMQSNLVPSSSSHCDPSRHICHCDIILASPGLIIFVRWSKTFQSISRAPEVPGHPANLVAAYQHLNPSSLARSPNQQFLNLYNVTVPMLAKALTVMLDALGLDSTYTVVGPEQLTDRAWTKLTSRSMVCGTATAFGLLPVYPPLQ